jgi:hypothetical protein
MRGVSRIPSNDTPEAVFPATCSSSPLEVETLVMGNRTIDHSAGGLPTALSGKKHPAFFSRGVGRVSPDEAGGLLFTALEKFHHPAVPPK